MVSLRRQSTFVPAGLRRGRCVTIAVSLILLIGACCGCQTLTPPGKSLQGAKKVPQPPGLNWLSSFVSEGTPGIYAISVEQLRSPEAAPIVHAGDLLELTVWDLYEPGLPHTSPLRIDEEGRGTPPLLTPVMLSGLTLGESEKILIDKYQGGELLLQPRVLVRRLETTSCTVQVLGGVERPGQVKLSHDQATVYHAILAAGGLKPHPSPAWLLTRYAPTTAVIEEELATASPESEAVSLDGKANPENVEVETKATEAETEAAVLESEDSEIQKVSTLNTAALVSEEPRTPVEERTFDLTDPQELQELKRLVLREGDVLRIPEQSPPIRITGVVRKPGNYPLNDSQTLSVREGLELAGGLLLPTLPAQVIVSRPVPGGQNVERWTLPTVKGELPPETPPLRPGDSLHVEVSPHDQVKRVIGGLRPQLWSGSAPTQTATDDP